MNKELFEVRKAFAEGFSDPVTQAHVQNALMMERIHWCNEAIRMSRDPNVTPADVAEMLAFKMLQENSPSLHLTKTNDIYITIAPEGKVAIGTTDGKTPDELEAAFPGHRLSPRSRPWPSQEKK